MLFSKKKVEENFVLKSFHAYSSAQSLGSKKKYRHVFEKSELTYLNVELTFINKLFDEEDWEADIRLCVKMRNGDRTELILENEETMKVPASEAEFIYGGGWGNDKKGDYWERGTYDWEFYLGDELLQSLTVYVEDEGPVSQEHNPYFSVQSFKTYESPIGTLEEEKRVYLKTFDVAQTRFVMGELNCENLIARDWQLEIFLNIYDDTGMLVGSSDVSSMVRGTAQGNESFSVTAGYGAKNPGFWVEDQYTIEAIFMDTVVAIIPFSMGQKTAERISDYEALLNEEVGSLYRDTIEIKKSNAELLDSPQEDVNSEDSPPEETVETPEENPTKPDSRPVAEVDPRSVEELLTELRGLIGLENIKAKVEEYLGYVRFLQYRKQAGIEEEEKVSLHSVFTGNPGTGKTTVVKLLGKIFHSMGLLSKGHVHKVDASDLVSGYIRHTGKDTKAEIEKARGGILFIDEAYMLFRKGMDNDFGPEAIAELLTEMSDGPGDIAIMVAGYPEEMEAFLKSNPGLKSRFRHYFHFEDYTPDELYQIAAYAAAKKAVTFSPEATREINKILREAYRSRDRSFGNARFAFSLVDEAKINLGIRLMKGAKLEKLDKTTLSTLQGVDIEDIRESSVAKVLSLEVDEPLLQESLAELDQLIGLEEIKQEVRELVKLSRYYRERDRNILKAFSMFSVFMGNPGTGKTTVARILAQVYKALGMLERGHLIDADGSDLIAGYVGQTALKTRELISKARGGVLLIDEAYAITDHGDSDFGRKAIAVLVKEMEDHRNEFGLIVAGYPQNMEVFLESNPGLKSRFDRHFIFEDFGTEDLWKIALDMYKGKGLTPDPKASAHLQAYLSFLHDHRDRFFGNARSVRKIVEKTSRNQHLRMAGLPKKARSAKALATLSLEDVQEFRSVKLVRSLGRIPIGFKSLS